MIFSVNKWKRIFDVDGSYEDTHVLLGIFNIILKGDKATLQGIDNTSNIVIENIFRTSIENDYVEICGFERDGRYRYIEIRCTQLPARISCLDLETL